VHEKIIRCFIAGVFGGIVKDLFDFLFYYGLHFVHYRYLDFAAAIIYGGKPAFWFDTAFAQFVELIFSGVLGILYATLIPNETNRNYLIKGWLYGVSIWLFLCIMGTIYKVPFFTKTPWQTSFGDFLTSSIYGIAMVWFLRFLNKRYETGQEV